MSDLEDRIREQLDKTVFRPPVTDPGAIIEVRSQETPAFANWPPLIAAINQLNRRTDELFFGDES